MYTITSRMATIKNTTIRNYAGMLKSVDRTDLKSVGITSHVGSTPTPGIATNTLNPTPRLPRTPRGTVVRCWVPQTRRDLGYNVVGHKTPGSSTLSPGIKQSPMKLLWVLVNCATVAEAKTIGQRALKERLAACFDIFPRRAAAYFWPPRTGKIETARGCLLVLETLPKHFRALATLVKKLHRDQLPFIGSLEIGNVSANYHRWLRGELRQ